VLLGSFLASGKWTEEVLIKNNIIFMIICKEIELTKNEILATIYVLVACFSMDLPLANRLI
jgi:hypothetical protein